MTRVVRRGRRCGPADLRRAMIRPELRRWALRHSEVLGAAGVALAGLWLIWLGGWILQALGVAVVLAGGAGIVIGLRRLRFRLPEDAPGVVEVLEGRIAYLGPETGGAVALSELSRIEIRVLPGGGAARGRCWRLRQQDGQTLMIPLAARGAADLYDLFAALPGMSDRALQGALTGPDRVIWSRDEGVARVATLRLAERS